MNESIEDHNLVVALIGLQRHYLTVAEFLRAFHANELGGEEDFLLCLVESGRITTGQADDIKSRMEDSTVTIDVTQDQLLAGIASRETNTTDVEHVHVTAESEECRYVPDRFLARGGQGQVWVARDMELHREVAFKEMLPNRIASATARDAFEREARITGRLEHPSIVPIYGFGHHNLGQSYYAMQLISGRSMQIAICDFHEGATSDKSMRFLGLLKNFTDVCYAVHYAHAAGIVHRDIKPSNIVLGEYGEAYLVDWGLAVSTGPSPDIVASHDRGTEPTIVGTPVYMSPEQSLGTISPLSDVYSLGATLYELLTGADSTSRPTEMQSLPLGVAPATNLLIRFFFPILKRTCSSWMKRVSRTRQQYKWR